MKDDKNAKTPSGTTFETARLFALRSPYWRWLGPALLRVVPVPTRQIPTAAVDKYWRVYYNPDFIGCCTAEQAAAVFVHEVWHLLRFHAKRAAALGVTEETHEAWNIAADIEIHANSGRLIEVLRTLNSLPRRDLAVSPVELGDFPDLPKIGIAETWYKSLLEKAKSKQGNKADKGNSQSGVGKGFAAASSENTSVGKGFAAASSENTSHDADGSGVSNIRRSFEIGPPDNPTMTPEVEIATVRAVAQAAKNEASRHPGCVPGNILRWADEVIHPPVSWFEEFITITQSVIAPIVGSSYWTYKVPSRRQSRSPEILMPGFSGTSPNVAVVVDTSGSMDNSDIGVCIGTTVSLLQAMLAKNSRNPSIRVYACDASCTEAQVITSVDKLKLVGGGGTDLRVALQKVSSDVSKSREELDMTVIVTDGETPWPQEPIPGLGRIITILTRTGTQAYMPGWMKQEPNKVVLAFQS